MNQTETRELKPAEKREAELPAEQTKPGLLFTPAVDIFETEKSLTIIADLPGVKTEDLEIDLRKDTLTIIGDVKSPESEGESDILREFRTGRYLRRFSLSEVINQKGIGASLKDGVLRLELPKVTKAVPRKIEVQAG